MLKSVCLVAQLLEPPPKQQSQQSQKVDSNNGDNVPATKTSYALIAAPHEVIVSYAKQAWCLLRVSDDFGPDARQ